MSWNPRYTAYARAHGRDERAQLEHDEDAWPGGRMCGFILWVRERWAAWDRDRRQGSDHVRGQAEHDAFTGWLAAECESQARV